MYPVIGLPPSFDGALHDKVTVPLPDTPLSAVGTLGTVAGVTAAEGVLAASLPTPLVAMTVKV